MFVLIIDGWTDSLIVLVLLFFDFVLMVCDCGCYLALADFAVLWVPSVIGLLISDILVLCDCRSEV